MLSIYTKFIIILSIIIVIFAATTPKGNAMEPISMSIAAAILLPIALEVAKEAMPYITQGAINFGGGLIDVFVDMAGIFLIPLGFAESTFGIPLGMFKSGIKHIAEGCLAPYKTTWSTLILPVRIFTG